MQDGCIGEADAGALDLRTGDVRHKCGDVLGIGQSEGNQAITLFREQISQPTVGDFHKLLLLLHGVSVGGEPLLFDVQPDLKVGGCCFCFSGILAMLREVGLDLSLGGNSIVLRLATLRIQLAQRLDVVGVAAGKFFVLFQDQFAQIILDLVPG